MKVPAYSWQNHSVRSGNHLYPGKNHFINFEQNQRHFQLQLDNLDEPELHPIRYETILPYADKCNPFYRSFRLPPQLLSNPVNESASTSCEKFKHCIRTDLTSWAVLKDNEAERTIQLIPYKGESEEFSVKITDEELAGLKDGNGDI